MSSNTVVINEKENGIEVTASRPQHLPIIQIVAIILSIIVLIMNKLFIHYSFIHYALLILIVVLCYSLYSTASAIDKGLLSNMNDGVLT